MSQATISAVRACRRLPLIVAALAVTYEIHATARPRARLRTSPGHRCRLPARAHHSDEGVMAKIQQIHRLAARRRSLETTGPIISQDAVTNDFPRADDVHSLVAGDTHYLRI